MADPKIKYDIEAAVKGEADAEQLAKALRNVGDALEGDLQQGAQEAAQALEALASKQRALESFRKLTNETGALSIELAQAKGELQQMDSQLAAASAATQQFAQAELKAKAALESKRADLVAAKKAYEDLQAGTVGAARKTEEYRQASQNARANIQQLSAEIKQQSRALKESETGTRTAQQAENALSAQHQKSSAALIQARGALQDNNAALSQATENMRAAGLSATNLAQQERNLQGAVEQVRQSVASMAPAYQQAAAASSQSTQVQAQNQRTLREGFTSIGTQLQRVQQIATVALGGSYAGGLIKDVAATADAFKNLEARIKLATGEGPLFQEAFRGVAEISLRTNSALDETGTLFTKLAKAGQEAGKSAQIAQRDALALTETINQTIQLSGGSADSAKAAIVQLIQGLQSGVLRGEEFNSVMEQAPRLAQAMANGLGVTTGELRKLANQGALTAETVMGALRGQADVVAGEFAKLPPTVGRALQNLSSQWTLYVGSADSGMVSSANAAKVINALSANLDTLVTTLQSAGKLWAAIKIAGLASDFGAWALKTLSATTAVEANTIAVGSNTVAQRGNSAAIAANAAAQVANTAATATSTAAKTANAASWASIATFAGQATRATQAATVATTAGAAAATAKTASLGLLGGAVRGVTSLLGGPVGLLATVVLFNGEIKRGATAVFEWGMSFTDAGQKLKQYEQAQRDAEGRQRAVTEAIKEQQAALERQAAAQEQARIKTFELSKESVGLLAQFDKLRKDGDSVTEAIGKIGKDFDLSNVPGIKNASAVLDMLLADGKLTAEQFQAAWSNALSGKDLAQFEVQARAAFSGAAREGERIGQMLDATVREAVKRSGLDFEQLQGKIGATSRSALNDLDAIVSGLGRLRDEGVDTGRVLVASLAKAIDTADSQKAIDEVRARVESLRKELGNKVTDGLLDQVKEKAVALKDSLDKALPGVSSLREAMKTLGIESAQSLQKTAREAQQAYGLIAKAGAEEGESYLAWQRRKEAAALVMIQRMVEANRGIVDSNIKARAAAEGLKVETDASGRTIIRVMRDAKKAVDDVGGSARSAAGDFRAMATAASDGAAAIKAMREQRDRNRVNPGDPNKSEIENLYDRHRMTPDQSDKDIEDIRKNVSGNVNVPQEYIDAQVAKMFGEDFVGNEKAQIAWSLKNRLEQYQKYGGPKSKEGSIEAASVRKALERAIAEVEKEREKRAAAANEERLKDRSPPERTSGGATNSGNAGGSGVTQRGAPTTVVNLNYNGAAIGSVNTDAAGRASLEQFMRALQDSRATAGR